MIPSIEDIFAMLRNGEISFEEAESYVRSHIASAEDTGMLRDVYAGLAMPVAMDCYHKGHKLSTVADKIADDAFIIADAMLKARDK